MRLSLVLLCTTALAACSGGGPTTVGANAVSVGNQPPTGTTQVHSFVNPQEIRTYAAIGSMQVYRYTTDFRPLNFTNNSKVQYQLAQVYGAEGSTARYSQYNITYNPRDAVFEIDFKLPQLAVTDALRFQDPAQRTDFGGQREPQAGVPNFENEGYRYLQVSDISKAPTPVYDTAQSTIFPIGPEKAYSDVTTFFYQKPGTVTKHVTLAGFVRNYTVIPEDDQVPYDYQNHRLERGVFAYGERTEFGNVPTKGTATFNGPMLASLVYNPNLDTDNTTPTYFQWMTGAAQTSVDFAASTFTFNVTGKVGAPLFDIYTSRVFVLQDGATFAAAAKGLIDLKAAAGFVGQFQTASFTQPNGTVLPVNIAGSSLDGAFFGPAAQEVGGGFRIVGGTPDERIDIVGAFTGK